MLKQKEHYRFSVRRSERVALCPCGSRKSGEVLGRSDRSVQGESGKV